MVAEFGQPSGPCGGQSSTSAVDPAARYPVKVVARIEKLEFVEMSELLQEAWALSSETSERNPLFDCLSPMVEGPRSQTYYSAQSVMLGWPRIARCTLTESFR